MQYEFSSQVEALLKAGKLRHMMTKDGRILPKAVDQSGKIVEIAKSVTGISLQTVFAPAQLALTGVMGGAQMYQTHRGFQAVLKEIQIIEASLRTIQNSLGVLQATTAVIGVGTVATVALSAVNLYQTIKLRQDLKQLGLEMKDGFLDLKKALKAQGEEILTYIDEVAQDVKFEQHRLELVKAYGRFLEATRLIKIAIACNDVSIRNADLANARQTLSEALAIYRNPHLLSEMSAPGQLRRFECAWAVEQTIAITYQLQSQTDAVSRCLIQLQERVVQDSLNLINNHVSLEELDFLFPELMRIRQHDLVVLNAWQQNIDWVRSLPANELKLLEQASSSSTEANSSIEIETASLDTLDTLNTSDSLPEQLMYENLKRNSHQPSLEIQLKLLMLPDLRQQYEISIVKKAEAAKHESLVPSNLKLASDLTIANLHCYFELQDSPREPQKVEVA
jgi:hypothetical protein